MLTSKITSIYTNLNHFISNRSLIEIFSSKYGHFYNIKLMKSQFDCVLDEVAQNLDEISALRVKVEPYRFISDIQKDNSHQKIKKHPLTLRQLINDKAQHYQNRKNRSADFGISNLSFQVSLITQQTLQNAVSPNKTQQSTFKRKNLRKKLYIQKKPTSFSPLHGQGILKQKDGSIVFGQWNKGDLIGKGKIIYSNGNIYCGQMKEYERHGSGILKYQNGYRYQGGFSNGKFQNYGTLFDEYGQVIDAGMWKNGVLIQQYI